MEEEPRGSRKKFQTLFNLMPDPVVIVDGKGKFLAVNDIVEEKTGFKREELLGKNFLRTKIVTAKSKALLTKNLVKVMVGKHVASYEVDLVTKDGEKLTVDINAAKIGYEGKPATIVIFGGITKRKRMEETLRESGERYRKQFDEALDAIFLADAETGIIIDCNRAASELVGREKSELVGKHQRILHPPENIEGEFSRTFKQHLKEKEGQILETQIITKRGEIKDVAIKANVFELGDKKLIQGIFRDITERKRVEEELARERDLLHVLMDNIPDTIYFKDTDSRFVKNNKAHAKVLGINDPKEAIGKTDFDFFTEEHARAAYADEQKIMKTGQPLIGKVEKPVRGKDGKYRWVSSTKVPIKDQGGRVIGMVGISRDITERKRVEEELARERDLLHALMDNIPDTIYFKDAASRFTRINKAQAKMLGIKNPEEAIGKTDFDFFTEEHARDTNLDEQEIMKTGQPLINKVEKSERPDRYFLWTSTTKVPIKNKEGQVTGMVGISRDITERKQMQEKLEEYSEHLEELVKKRTGQLKEAQERLLKSERLAAIGEVAGMVGHDLRNPLQAVFNTFYLAKKKMDYMSCPLVEKQGLEELCDRIQKQLNYMNKIVSDLQDYARPLKPELVGTNLNQLINDTLSTITVPENTVVSIEVEMDFEVMVDPLLMKRVFTNLFKNA